METDILGASSDCLPQLPIRAFLGVMAFEFGGTLTIVDSSSLTSSGEETGSRTVTRADIAAAVHKEVRLSRTASAEIVDIVLAEISNILASGEMVKLSKFGCFVVRAKGGRIGRNPKTGAEAPISARRVVVFKASNTLKDRINGVL
jgi:integration host factor subunit alpha